MSVFFLSAAANMSFFLSLPLSSLSHSLLPVVDGALLDHVAVDDGVPDVAPGRHDAAGAGGDVGG